MWGSVGLRQARRLKGEPVCLPFRIPEATTLLCLWPVISFTASNGKASWFFLRHFAIMPSAIFLDSFCSEVKFTYHEFNHFKWTSQ